MEAAASAVAVPLEHRDWVEKLRHGGSTPMSTRDSSHGTSNSWSCLSGDVFSVRGADYMKTHAKVAGGECLLQPLAFDFLQGPCPIAHVMNHPNSRVRSALDAAIRAGPQTQCQPFVWAFNIQLGNKNHHSVVYYFVSFSCAPPQGSLMQRFLDGDDAFRDSRLKFLLRLPEAPRLAQVVVGDRWPVCMLGKVMKCTYTREKNFIEVDVDANSSILTRAAVKLTFGLAPLIVADVAFVLEGNHADELPERILGAMRLVKVEPSSAYHMDTSEITRSDVPMIHEGPPKGLRAKVKKLSKSTSKDLLKDFRYKRPAERDEVDGGEDEAEAKSVYL